MCMVLTVFSTAKQQQERPEKFRPAQGFENCQDHTHLFPSAVLIREFHVLTSYIQSGIQYSSTTEMLI